MNGRRGDASGIHLVLGAGKDAIGVHVGPAWYVDRQSLRLAKGDRVTVRGSRVTWAGAPAIVAIEVRRGDDILKRGTEAGVPLWSNRMAAPP